MATVLEASTPTVLVVDDDPACRQLVRLSLAGEGVDVREAASLREARPLLAGGLRAVVLDRHLPDGDGLDLVPELQSRFPGVPVLVFTNAEDHAEPTSVVRIAKEDVLGLLAALGPVPGASPIRSAVEVLQEEAGEVAREWRDLCRCDPNLPADAEPPLALTVVRAVAGALERPQPLGWGSDRDIEEVAGVFAGRVGAVDVAVGQLVCLREAFRRRLQARLPVIDRETELRLQMVIDRAIGVAAGRAAERLRDGAFVDALTGLPNRRALERVLRREIGRGLRHGCRFSMLVLDVEGLDEVNRSQGHGAGDSLLRSVAGAMLDAARVSDSAYRTGEDEFALLLPETPASAAGHLTERLSACGVPPFRWAAVGYPDDGDEADAILELAGRRLAST